MRRSSASLEVDQLTELVDAPAGVGARQAVEPALQQEQLGSGLARVERGFLQRGADAQAHRAGLRRRRRSRRPTRGHSWARAACTACAQSSTCPRRWVRGIRRSRRLRRRGRRRSTAATPPNSRTTDSQRMAEVFMGSPLLEEIRPLAGARTHRGRGELLHRPRVAVGIGEVARTSPTETPARRRPRHRARRARRAPLRRRRPRAGALSPNRVRSRRCRDRTRSSTPSRVA